VEIVESGRRFGYFIIDSILLFVVQIALAFPVFFLTEGFSVTATAVILQLAPLLSWFGYYFLFEFYSQQTPGKMILGYVVINDQAQSPSPGKVALRTICRLIPFEAFSCLSERGGWHDRFSQTYVVSKDERTKLQRLMGGVAEMDNELLDQ
jgi:uncharacterized RDD family membrane protein YckC